MSAAPDPLQDKIAEMLTWERRKQREHVLISILCSAVALALLVLPFHDYFSLRPLRWFIPLVVMAGLAPWAFYRGRWRHRDTMHALVQLDKRLDLAERATTAWELSARTETSAVAELVYKQARERLRAVNVRSLFPRRWGWQSYTLLPLFLGWFSLLWFDVDQTFFAQPPPVPTTIAGKLREYSRELQEKAQSEGLPESLKAGQELEKVARKNIEAHTSNEQFKEELAGVARDMAASAKGAADASSPMAGETQQGLQDLRAELGAAQNLLNFPDSADGRRELPQHWTDRLASLPQLKRHLDSQPQAGPGLGQQELRSFLDRLDQQATRELDRRALLDAQKFLQQMMQSGAGNRRESDMRTAGRGEQESFGDGVRDDNRSSQPGKEPGKIDPSANSLPEFRGGAQTQVKGSLGDGDSSGIEFKGNPTAGKSKLEQQAVIANYRRQAEQELNSERVPAELKATVRNYFLSLAEEKQ